MQMYLHLFNAKLAGVSANLFFCQCAEITEVKAFLYCVADTTTSEEPVPICEGVKQSL